MEKKDFTWKKEILVHSMAGEIFQGCSNAQVSKMLNHDLVKEIKWGLWSTEMDRLLKIFGWDFDYNYMEEQLIELKLLMSKLNQKCAYGLGVFHFCFYLSPSPLHIWS